MTELPKPGVAEICPHCGRDVPFVNLIRYKAGQPIGHEIVVQIEHNEVGKPYRIVASKCSHPECDRLILIRQKLIHHENLGPPAPSKPDEWIDDQLIWPKGIIRKAPVEVPKKIAKDYVEAYAVFPMSKTATALMARRCLQHTIHDAAKKHDQHLDKEIKAIRESLPDDLKEMPTLIRLLGKIAAHPKEDSKTGEILEVDPEEAEFSLTIIEYLFEHYYTKPAKEKKLADQIKAKAARAGGQQKKK